MPTLISPLNISFNEWASQIRISLPDVVFPLPPDVKNWRNWAAQVVNSNALQNVPLPTEIGYPNDEDWNKWAAYFINNIYN